MDTVVLKVNKILKVTGAFAHVSICGPAFEAIKGFSPLMPYTTARNQASKGVRIFDFDGVKVFSCFVKGEGEEYGKAKVLMLTEDANRLKAESDAERANEPVLEFDETAFAVREEA